MKDSELESLLRSSRVPKRPDGYWADFPGRITQSAAAAGRGATRQSMHESGPGWLAPVAWGTALAMACVMIGFGIGASNRSAIASLLKHSQALQCQWTSAPTQFAILARSDQALRRTLSETP